MTRLAVALSAAFAGLVAAGSAPAAPATTTLSLSCTARVAATDRDYVTVTVVNSTPRSIRPGTLVRVRLVPASGGGPVYFTAFRATQTVPPGGTLVATTGPAGTAYAASRLNCAATVAVKIEPRGVPRIPPFNPDSAKR